jgi:hypothetical protein
MAVKTGRPCLYFSADSDDLTMSARAASIVSGHSTATIRSTQEAGLFHELYAERLAELPIRFVFDPSEPSVSDIENAILAYYELWAEYPEIIVIDNLWNTSSEGEEWTGMRTIVKDLHYLARRTKASIWVLHHTSEQDKTWLNSAPPRMAIQGKLSQLPSLILTMANDQREGLFWLAVVKWRHGASDPHAEDPLRMIMDFTTNRLYDTPMMAT